VLQKVAAQRQCDVDTCEECRQKVAQLLLLQSAHYKPFMEALAAAKVAKSTESVVDVGEYRQLLYLPAQPSPLLLLLLPLLLLLLLHRQTLHVHPS
jgi:hypothetical protein